MTFSFILLSEWIGKRCKPTSRLTSNFTTRLHQQNPGFFVETALGSRLVFQTNLSRKMSGWAYFYSFLCK